MYFKARTVCFACILLLSWCLAGCETLRYFGQAAKGQLSLLTSRKKVAKLLTNADTDSQLKANLQHAVSLLDFAEERLALKRGRNYRHYVQLSDPYVLWNVFVAPEFSITGVHWCFPIAGCVPYRGYFRQKQAHRFAARQIEAGFDIYIGGVRGYSTLGWLPDPLMSSFFDSNDIGLAGLLFHELAHAVLYVPGDSTFNESFATVVEQVGVCLWLTEQGRADEFRQWHKNTLSYIAFGRFIADWRARLQKLYASSNNPDVLRPAKAETFIRMKADYERQPWSSNGRYDGFMAADLNNAQLNTVAIYLDLVAPLRQLLETQNFSLPAFYAKTRELAGLSKPEREQRLETLRMQSVGKDDDANSSNNCGANEI